CQEYGTLLTF
nr:immunoglobulin light chain junction region [Macaca mulatta]